MNTHSTPTAPPKRYEFEQKELDQLLFAVREAGALAMSFFGQSPRSELKADGTSVSEADLAADALLKERLLKANGAYGWLSEESEDDLTRLNKSRVWVVDPIDGTRAFLNDKPISVCEPVELEGSCLAASKSQLLSRQWESPWPEFESLWVNSIAYRLALVAAGKCDGTVSLSAKSDWDIAAAHLLVDEAGGIVTTHDAGQLVYNLETPRHVSVVSAGPALHSALIARTSQATL